MDVARPACSRCRRPLAVCVCAHLRPVASRARVVFLQHPREAKVAVSTCRLAHLSLPNSELHVGMGAEGNARLEALARAPGTMVLFPGPDSVDVNDLAAPPDALVVVDGTWTNARKVLQRSPLLAALPRIGFTPERPGNYRIRKEPAAECVSTIEAVAHVLEQLERAPGRFTPMLASFERMVDLQLGYAAGASRAAVHPAIEALRALGDRLVIGFAEGNLWPGEAAGEVLHWAAVRPGSGERFEARIRPRRPLAPYTERYLGLPEAELREPFAEAALRWGAFARPDDVIGTWGRFSTELLRAEGVGFEALDLKAVVCDALKRPAGGVERLAGRLGATLPDGDGLARRKLAALEAVIAALFDGRLP